MGGKGRLEDCGIEVTGGAETCHAGLMEHQFLKGGSGLINLKTEMEGHCVDFEQLSFGS